MLFDSLLGFFELVTFDLFFSSDGRDDPLDNALSFDFVVFGCFRCTLGIAEAVPDSLSSSAFFLLELSFRLFCPDVRLAELSTICLLRFLIGFFIPFALDELLAFELSRRPFNFVESSLVLFVA